MYRFLAIAETGLAAVLLHYVRSLVTLTAIVAVLVPYLTGIAISRAMRDQAELAVDYGADLNVTGEQFGRPVPIPASTADAIRQIPGVRDATPRIVGRMELGKNRVSAIVVGIALAHLPSGLECIEGRLYGDGPRNELIIGSGLAKLLSLKVGSLIPPFYQNRSGERVSEVVGIFRSDVGPWQARLILTSFESATRIFDQPGLATDVLVDCESGYIENVRIGITREVAVAPGEMNVRTRVRSRMEARDRLIAGPDDRESALTLLSVIAFSVAILVVLVTSGIGLTERRRETGILKTLGWQNDELLFRSFVECLTIGLLAAALSIVLAYVWLEWLNGYGIAGVFLPGTELSAGFKVPYRLTPAPVLLAVLIAMVVISSGSLYATWRAATAQPRESMR